MDAARAPHRVAPRVAVEGGTVTIEGPDLPFHADRAPAIFVGALRARVVSSSTRRIRVALPAGLEGGRATITCPDADAALGEIHAGTPVATDLHIVDNPAVDAAGRIYATFSGSRGQRVPVSIFRIDPDGSREPIVSGIVNATSLAFDNRGDLCVSSRYDGAVYRVARDGRVDKIASDLGVACGLAFGPDGSLFVGDRSGTLFRVNAAGRVIPFASLPPSIAAFHLAVGPEEDLYVTGPTLSSSDVVYRVDRRGEISVFATGFGRPQGLAFDRRGRLHVVEALAGAAGLYRILPGGRAELMVSGMGLVGVAFPASGGLVLASHDTVYRVAEDLS